MQRENSFFWCKFISVAVSPNVTFILDKVHRKKNVDHVQILQLYQCRLTHKKIEIERLLCNHWNTVCFLTENNLFGRRSLVTWDQEFLFWSESPSSFFRPEKGRLVAK